MQLSHVFASLLVLQAFHVRPAAPQEPREGTPRPSPADYLEHSGVRELTGRLIVRPRSRATLREQGVSDEQASRLRAEARSVLTELDVQRYIRETDESIVRVPAGESEESLASKLLASRAFEYAEPDWLLYPAQVAPLQAQGARQVARNCPDDFIFPSQWHHATDRLGSCEAWALETGGPAVAVAVCDTGLRTTHEDLQGHRLEGYNAVDRLWESEGGQIGPAYYHGTRVTGVLTARGDNGVGVAGIGWNFAHRMVRVSNQSNGGAFLSDLQHGARTAIENGDRVANVSYHGAQSASNATTAAYIRSLGGMLVWGSGNTGSFYSGPDRDSDTLLIVGATTSTDTLWIDSTHGASMDLVAPGVSITTCDSSFDGDYATASGTSYAAPMVSGLCGLLWSRRPNLTPSDVEAILKASCTDLGAPGVDDFYGYGRIDLVDALMESGVSVPVADFAAPLTEGASPLEVHFRDLSTGVTTSWHWDFGDGTTSSAQNPVHTYTQSGRYSVSLTVGNGLGVDVVAKVDYVLVDVIPPIADLEADVTGGLSPLTVQFSDTSAGGPPDTWLWDFGDGTTSSLSSPSHVYTTSGIYDVSLTVSNAYGQDTRVRQGLVAVDWIPPQAGFSATPTAGNSPLVVQFSDESVAGVASSWSWSFGDGVGSSSQYPSHTYSAAGTYTVSLTASNSWGSDQLTRFGYITVGPGPSMIADFEGTPTTGPAPLTVQFTDLTIGPAVAWTWEFDDGTTSIEQNPQHTFSLPGTYNIGLQVDDAGGADSTIEKRAYIVVQ